MITKGNIFRMGKKMFKLCGGIVLEKEQENARPVKITEGILKANGFRFEDCRWKYGNELEGVEVVQYHDLWSVKVFRSDKAFQGWLKYVHELQNAMDVCDLDKDWVCE